MEEEWEAFLSESENGTIFHSQRFLSYHRPDKFRHHHLIFMLRGKMRAIFTGAEIQSDKGLTLRSHPGASYGGIVLKRESDFEDYYGIIEALLNYSRENGIKSLSLTQTPTIYNSCGSQGVEFALTSFGFKSAVVELTQSVNLTRLGYDAFESVVDKTRNACRQARKKGVIYQEDVPLSEENIRDFYEILVENRRALNVTPTHTEEELNRLVKLIPENLHLAFAEAGGERIAGLLHFICNPRVVLLFYVCHRRDKQSLKAAPFLLTNTLNWAKREGFEQLDFGISTVKGDPNTGLLKFKENFKTKPYLRTTYSIDLE